MEILLIIVVIAAVILIAYKISKKTKPVETLKDTDAPEKIEPIVLVKKAEKVTKPAAAEATTTTAAKKNKKSVRNVSEKIK